MDHATAIETHAAERYLLGELTGPDAEMFEEHYFDCAACAEDVRDGARLLEVGREVALTEPKQAAPPVENAGPRSSRGWTSLAAAATLLIGVGLGTVVRDRGANAIHVMPAYQTGVNRDGKNVVYRVDEPIVVAHDFDEGDAFSVEIHTNGNVVRRQKLKPELRNTTGLISAGELPAGAYEMLVISVHADGNRAVTSYSFKVVE